MLACWRQLGADHDRCAKHLPFTELFLQEAVKNNILGSRLLANFDFHGYQRGPNRRPSSGKLGRELDTLHHLVLADEADAVKAKLKALVLDCQPHLDRISVQNI